MQYKLFRNTQAETNSGTIFRAIYKAGELSRQEIVNDANLSLPTVRQALNELFEKGLIGTNKYYKSTGGRRASAISVEPAARIAIGVELLKENIQISAVDLLGKVIKEERCRLPYKTDEDYFRRFGALVSSFISGLHTEEENILGVLIALQGIIAQDGETLLTGKILHNSGLTAESFQKYIRPRCRFINDTVASAFAELWASPEIKDAAYIVLNKNLAGAVIMNGRVFQGDSIKGIQNCGMLSHMRLVPGGIPCYCGQKGCIQGYCSVNSLETESELDIETFMKLVHSGDEKCRETFDRYLSYLALGVNNIRMIFDTLLIVGGYLEELMTDGDLELLAAKVKEESPFDDMTFRYERSRHGSNAPARGAALIQINDFIDSI